MHLMLLLSVSVRVGKTLAAEFAKRGQKVAIIERSDKMYGGTCINIGCSSHKDIGASGKNGFGSEGRHI